MTEDVKPLVDAVVRKDVKNMVEWQYQHDCRHWTQYCVLEDHSRGHTGWLHLQVSKGKSHPWVLWRSAALSWTYDEEAVQEMGSKYMFGLYSNGVS